MCSPWPRSSAICHGAEDAWTATVGEHLGYRHTRHNTRRLRQQLERLRVGYGWAASEERLGREYWRLTPDGQRHLALTRAEGLLGELPESPQHRTWRKARATAAERIEDFKALLWRATEEATTFEGVAEPPPSSWWFDLFERPGRCLLAGRLGPLLPRRVARAQRRLHRHRSRSRPTARAPCPGGLGRPRSNRKRRQTMSTKTKVAASVCRTTAPTQAPPLRRRVSSPLGYPRPTAP
jgi:hypothetical protein